MHIILAFIIGCIAGGVTAYLFRADESDLIEQGKQIAYNEVLTAKNEVKKL